MIHGLTMLGGGALKKTSIVHMRVQRISKHTLIEICPFEETLLNKNFAWFHTKLYSLNKIFFLRNMFDGIEEFEKWPLNAPW